ncbi:MAG: cytochrome c [Bacteroidia bacterium]
MKAFTLLFGTIAALAFICIGLFAYFSFKADWSRLAEKVHEPDFGYAVIYPSGYDVSLNELESKGETLFKANCAACHKAVGRLVGPQLAGIQAKYADDRQWLYSWVKNSSRLIQDGDAKAVALFEAYNKQQMTAFPTLKDEEIDAILAYADAVGK